MKYVVDFKLDDGSSPGGVQILVDADLQQLGVSVHREEALRIAVL